jgi:hypothetical protein
LIFFVNGEISDDLLVGSIKSIKAEGQFCNGEVASEHAASWSKQFDHRQVPGRDLFQAPIHAKDALDGRNVCADICGLAQIAEIPLPLVEACRTQVQWPPHHGNRETDFRKTSDNLKKVGKLMCKDLQSTFEVMSAGVRALSAISGRSTNRDAWRNASKDSSYPSLGAHAPPSHWGAICKYPGAPEDEDQGNPPGLLSPWV